MMIAKIPTHGLLKINDERFLVKETSADHSESRNVYRNFWVICNSVDDPSKTIKIEFPGHVISRNDLSHLIVFLTNDA